MLLRDPRAPDDVDGRPDDYVAVQGDLVAVEDGTFEHPAIDEAWAREYADRQGVDYEQVVVDAGYPTNDDGEPLCTGKDEGQCSRVVDEPGGTCWQHDD